MPEGEPDDALKAESIALAAPRRALTTCCMITEYIKAKENYEFTFFLCWLSIFLNELMICLSFSV